MPSPAGVKSPAPWGRETHLHELFGTEAASVRAQPRIFRFRYASPAHMIQVFRDYHGPVHKAFAALDPDGRQALEQELTALLRTRHPQGQAHHRHRRP